MSKNKILEILALALWLGPCVGGITMVALGNRVPDWYFTVCCMSSLAGGLIYRKV